MTCGACPPDSMDAVRCQWRCNNLGAATVLADAGFCPGGVSVTRNLVRPSGRTPCETLKHKRDPSGEMVLIKLGTPWSKKIWLGRSEISDEHLCGCSDGVTRHRKVRR